MIIETSSCSQNSDLDHHTSCTFIAGPSPGCGDPGTPENGRRIGDDFSVGSVVFFKCFDDYDLVGSAYRECLSTGVWSGTQPTCQPFVGKGFP